MTSILEVVPEDDLREAMFAEYKKRLTLYKLTNERFKKKYGMSFEEFEKKGVVKERNFSWEVESDAIEWEHAIEGIRYVSSKLGEMEKLWKSGKAS